MGTFWCKCLHSLQIVIVLVSAFSIAMIAVDRCVFVVYSARSTKLTAVRVAYIIAAIWAVAVALAAPTFAMRSTGQLYDQTFFDMIKDLKSQMNKALATVPNKPELSHNVTLLDNQRHSLPNTKALGENSLIFTFATIKGYTS